MLELHYRRASYLGGIRSSWVYPGIERYAAWLIERQSANHTFRARISRAWTFCQFAIRRGAKRWEELPSHLDQFLAYWARRPDPRRQPRNVRGGLIGQNRRYVGQFLAVAVPSPYEPNTPVPLPFLRVAPGFWDHLTHERGLRPATLRYYTSYLREFEGYLRKLGPWRLSHLSPRIIDGFIGECSKRLSTLSLRTIVAVLRVLVRYLHRERILPRDFSSAIEGPIIYRLSSIPASITWDEVSRLLRAVDLSFPGGIRNKAILLLLVCYGLRAGDVARLRLEDIDWRNNRLHVLGRKSGNSTVYPLSQIVGEAVLDYLRRSRPKSADRHVFLTAIAPRKELSPIGICTMVRWHIRRAGIQSSHQGPHILRHTCVQRLVDSGFPLKTIGDYVGHHSVASTEIYSKINLESLREVAMGEGEAAL